MSGVGSKCPRCGITVPTSTLAGLCPACVLGQVLSAADTPETERETGWVDESVLEAMGLVRDRPATRVGRFGDFRLEGELGRGGMGVIYRVHQLSLNRPVALKMIITGPLGSLEFARRLRVEAEVAAGLDHPNIVPIYEVGEHEGQPFYTMRMVEGPNLAQALKSGPFEPKRAARLMATVARAMQHAHERGVLHRDLKPSNILLDARDQPHITDFGLAKMVHSDSSLTLSQAALGTPNYMAPEQAAGASRQVTTAADIYSLGAILYELLTGQPLFQAATPLQAIRQAVESTPERPSRINPRVDRDLETTCLKCLEKEPKLRYPSAAALAEELDRFLNGEPIQARSIGPVGRLWSWCRRKPVVAGMSGAVIVLLLVVSAGSLLATRRIAAEARRVEEWARELRLNLYVADMNIASQSYYRNSLGHVSQIVHDYLPGALGHQFGTDVGRFMAKGEEDLRGWEWRYLWGVCRDESLWVMEGHTNGVSCAVFSPNGETVVTAGFDATVRVWDVETRRMVRLLTGFADPIPRYSVAFSPDGSILAVADGTEIHLYASATWEKLRTLPNLVLSGGLFSLGIAFSPDGQILSCNAETEVRHWDTASWQRRASRPAKLTGDFYRLLAYSPDGRYFATGTNTGILLWDATRDLSGPIYLGPLYAPKCVTFSPGGQWVAAGGRYGQVMLWDVEQKQEFMRLPANPWDPIALAFSPDGKQLAVDEAQIIRLWEIPQGKLVSTLKSTFGGVYGLMFSPDGQTLVSATGDRKARLWSARSKPASQAVLTFGVPLCFSSDGLLLTVLSTNSSVESWDLRSGQKVGSFDIPAPVGATDRVAASIDGQWVAHIASNGLARVWDRVTGRQMAETTVEDPLKMYNPVFSPDGSWLALSGFSRNSGGTGQTVLWDFLRDKRRRVPGKDIYCPVFSPRGDVLATGCGKDVQLYRLPDLEPLHRLGGHYLDIEGLAFSPDGALLLSASNGLRLWDVATGRLRRLFYGYPGAILPRPAAFSADGRTVGTGWGPSLALWNVASGRVIFPIKTEYRHLGGPMFSPDGKTLVIGGSRGLPIPEPIVVMRAPAMEEIQAKREGR